MSQVWGNIVDMMPLSTDHNYAAEIEIVYKRRLHHSTKRERVDGYTHCDILIKGNE